jgi:hypothetical protein
VDFTTAIAIYGAVLSTAGVAVGTGWEVYKWRRDRGTYIEVRTSLGITGGPVLLIINVKNKSQHQVRVPEVGFKMQDESQNNMVITHPDLGELPLVVAPNDSGMIAVNERQADGRLDLYKPAIAYVRLSTDEYFYSKPTTLRKR